MMKRRALALALCLSLLLALAAPSGTAYAASVAGEDTQHTWAHEDSDAKELTFTDGRLFADGREITSEKVTVGYNTATCYVLPAGNYYLPESIAINLPLAIKEGIVNLCLNSKTLTCSASSLGAVIKIMTTTSTTPVLNLYDCGTGGAITGGKAQNNTNSLLYGGGVFVRTGGTFNMYGGKITGNNGGTSNGGGVYVSGGTFNLYSGEISGNQTSYTGKGGGVYLGSAEFNMYGGTISANTAADGGGIAVCSGSTATIHGGEIKNHSGVDSGAGIYVDSSTSTGTNTLTVNGGTISGNRANGNSPQQGGGIYACSSITLNGGEITGNFAPGGGGGVYFCSSNTTDCVTLSGDVRITGNYCGSSTYDPANNLCLDNSTNGSKNSHDGVWIGESGLGANASIGLSVSDLFSDGGYIKAVSGLTEEDVARFSIDQKYSGSIELNYSLTYQSGNLYLHKAGAALPVVPHTHDGITYTSLSQETANGPLKANGAEVTENDAAYGLFPGGYYLTSDIVTNKPISISGETSICLNGHTIKFEGDGAAIYVTGRGAISTLNLCDCQKTGKITGTSTGTGNGGGIYVDENGGIANIKDITITGNVQKGNGGGIYNAGTTTLTNVTITDSRAVYGGGIYNGGTLTLDNCSICGNQATSPISTGTGGGIQNNNRLTIIGGEITGNTADESGGGVQTTTGVTLSGDLQITDNTVKNTPNNLFFHGGLKNYPDLIENLTGLTGGKIGITLSSVLLTGENTPRIIKESAPAGSSEWFTSDYADYVVQMVDNNLCLVKKLHTHSESGTAVTLDTPLTADGKKLKAGDTTLTAQTIHLYTTITNRHSYEVSSCYVLPEGNYYLPEDVTLNYPIAINGTVNLCLNGHTLTYDNSANAKTNKLGAVIKVLHAATIRTTDGEAIADPCLNLYDCPQDGVSGKITGGTGGKAQNQYTLNELCIGGGVSVVDWNILCGYSSSSNARAAFNMYGGEISGNTVASSTGVPAGGGVYAAYSKFNLYDGKISDNSASGGSTGSLGGGVSLNGAIFNIYGGEISGNSSSEGGGVSVGYGATLTLTDGKIIGNHASENGGGIHTVSPITIAGGEISGNTVSTDAEGNGGLGGGVHCPYVAMGGRSVTLSGAAKITGNTSDDRPSNLYMHNSPSNFGIKIGEGGLQDGASIGVSVSNPPTEGSAVQINLASETIEPELIPEGSLFADDSENYHVEHRDDKKLYLVTGDSPVSSSHIHTGGAGGSVTFDPIADLNATLAAGKNYVLTADCTPTGTVTIPSGEVHLCLDGHTVTAPSGTPVFTVKQGATLHLYGCSDKTFETLLNGGSILIENGGKLVYTGNKSPADTTAETKTVEATSGNLTVAASGAGFQGQGGAEPGTKNHAEIHPDPTGRFKAFNKTFAGALQTKTPLATGHVTNPAHSELYYDLPAGDYYMTENVELDMAMEVHDTTNFCLFDHDLTAWNSIWEYDQDHVFWVPDKAVLNVCDCLAGLNIVWLYGGSVHLRGTGRLNLVTGGGPQTSFTLDGDGTGSGTLKFEKDTGTVALPPHSVLTQTSNGQKTVIANKEGTVEITPPGGGSPSATLALPAAVQEVQLFSPNSLPEGTAEGQLVLEVPAESSIQSLETENAPRIDLPESGGTLDTAGHVTAETVTVTAPGEQGLETTVAAPQGGQLEATLDGEIEFPAGSTITAGAIELTIGESGDGSEAGQINANGQLSVAPGSKITAEVSDGSGKSSRTIVIALPKSGDGDPETPDLRLADGGMALPGGATLTTTVPAQGGKPSRTIVIALPYPADGSEPEVWFNDEGQLILPPDTKITETTEDGQKTVTTTDEENNTLDPDSGSLSNTPDDPNKPDDPNNPDVPDKPIVPDDAKDLPADETVTTDNGTEVNRPTEDTVVITPADEDKPPITLKLPEPDPSDPSSPAPPAPKVDGDGNVYIEGPFQVVQPEDDGQPDTPPIITVTPSDDTPVKVTPDGEVELPGGSEITVPQPENGPIQVTVPEEGGTVVLDPDGEIKVGLPGGGEITVPQPESDPIQVTVPEGGTVVLNPDGIIDLPPDTTVTVNGKTVQIADTGGTLDPSTGEVTGAKSPAPTPGQSTWPNQPVRPGSGGVPSGGGSVPAPDAGQNGDCPRDETCPIWPYTDSIPTAWYHDGVHYCIDEDLMIGTGPALFEPDIPLTRAMIMQVLYNRAGRPQVTGDDPFTDVKPGTWYWQAIRWAADEGIALGYGDGRFGPNDPVTREQLAAAIWRDAGWPASEYELTFSDASVISEYAVPALRWNVERGIVVGYPDSTFRPQDNATRAEAAQMFYRYFTREAYSNRHRIPAQEAE